MVFSEPFPEYHACPTGCDTDCELNPDGCHERHQVRWKRDHDPDECEDGRWGAQRQITEAEYTALLPRRMQAIADHLSEVLPEGFRFEWGPVPE